MNWNSTSRFIAFSLLVAAAPLILMLLRYVTLKGSPRQLGMLWSKHAETNYVIRILLLIFWCAVYELLNRGFGAERAFWCVPVTSNFVADLTLRFTGRIVANMKRTAAQILRLAFWGTVCPTVSLLFIACGLHALLARQYFGFFWFPLAGVTALAGTLRLQSARGINMRRVKSGTLFARTMHLAKRAGIKIARVYVVPAGRGRLTNAFAMWRGVALTDNFGEYLGGPELDAVISHELGHVQGKHTRKHFVGLIATISVIFTAALLLPVMKPLFRAEFMLFSLLTLLLIHYGVLRRFEYECDRKAAELTGDARAVIRSLIALHEEAAAPTGPYRLLEMFVTHPSLIHRVKAIGQFAGIDEDEKAQFVRRCELLFEGGVEKTSGNTSMTSSGQVSVHTESMRN